MIEEDEDGKLTPHPIRSMFELSCMSMHGWRYFERHPDGWYREDRVEYAFMGYCLALHLNYKEIW